MAFCAVNILLQNKKAMLVKPVLTVLPPSEISDPYGGMGRGRTSGFQSKSQAKFLVPLLLSTFGQSTNDNKQALHTSESCDLL